MVTDSTDNDYNDLLSCTRDDDDDDDNNDDDNDDDSE